MRVVPIAVWRAAVRSGPLGRVALALALVAAGIGCGG